MGSTADLPSPVPVIDKVLLNGSGETACIDICGKHFTSNLKVLAFRPFLTAAQNKARREAQNARRSFASDIKFCTGFTSSRRKTIFLIFLTFVILTRSFTSRF